MKYNKT